MRGVVYVHLTGADMGHWTTDIWLFSESNTIVPPEATTAELPQ